MSPADVEALFRRSDGSYAFARWGRPIAPVVFGVDDATLGIVKGAVEAVVTLAGHQMAETDPELGANFMVFFIRDWRELSDATNLEGLVPDLDSLVLRLDEADANQYRLFRFDADGAIRAVVLFLRMNADLSSVPAETLALGQVVQSMLLWSDRAFKKRSVVAQAPGGAVILRPEIGDVIRAAYDPVMPTASGDPAHAIRLAARLGLAA